MADNARDLGQPQAEDLRSGERRRVSWSAYVGGGAAATSTGDGGDTGEKAASAQKK